MCLYEDNYVKVYKTELVIDGYYFPTYKSKTIKLVDIKHVYYKKQIVMSDFGKVKEWGMAIAPIWWASDVLRPVKKAHYNVVLDTGSRIKKGFTVVRIEDFLNALKQIIPDVPYINEIPFFGNIDENPQEGSSHDHSDEVSLPPDYDTAMGHKLLQ